MYNPVYNSDQKLLQHIAQNLKIPVWGTSSFIRIISERETSSVLTIFLWGYTFQKLWNNSSSLRLTFGVQNVATFTGYSSGIDPEIYSGIDKEVYPRPAYFHYANLNF